MISDILLSTKLFMLIISRDAYANWKLPFYKGIIIRDQIIIFEAGKSETHLVEGS